MGQGDPSFQELLARARQGEVDALAKLARLYEADLLIAARVHLGPALRPYLDSLDLVQSVHRSLMLGLRKDKFAIDDPRSLLALALTMVRRKVARQWRRHRRQVRPTGEHPTDVLLTLSRRQVSPEAMAEVRDSLDRLWRDLDPFDRALIELRLEGLSTAESAARLQKSPEALRLRLHRLRKRLESEQVLSEWL